MIEENQKRPRKTGIVLSAGGARAAYQVGVLRYVAEEFPNFRPTIFTGVSAGSISASFLAQGEPFPVAVSRLHSLWENIEFSQVLQTNFESIWKMGMRWVYDLFVSKVTKRLLVKSILDASPLTTTLLNNIHFWKINRAIRAGLVEGLSISATNYHNGTTTFFYDSTTSIPSWRREQRQAIRTPIRVRHIMASCSIPLLFEPVRIGDYFYGDGAMRFGFPLSPALHLGATHLFAVGIRCPAPENPLAKRQPSVGLGFVAGAVLNSIFLDSLEADFENLMRMNRLSEDGEVKVVPSLLIRPSRDLGALAKDSLGDVPFHFRQALRSLASPEELGDLLSYLMFSKSYIVTLLKQGYEDAAGSHDQIAKFLA